MDRIENLMQYLQEYKPYPCLHLLEASLASRIYCTDGEIPKELIQDIGNALGGPVVQNEIANLLKLGILEEMDTAKGQGVRLKEQKQCSMEDLLRQLRCNMEMDADSGCKEACEYLGQLVDYLLHSDSGISVKENKSDDYLLESDGKTYRLLLTLSPFWLPLAAEKNEEEEQYILAFGPFAAQAWNGMYPYYAWEDFRSRVALYDPWVRQKISLCKGRLPVYIDWFYRDRYHRRFSIPIDFCEALHNMGLLRYNDER